MICIYTATELGTHTPLKSYYGSRRYKCELTAWVFQSSNVVSLCQQSRKAGLALQCNLDWPLMWPRYCFWSGWNTYAYICFHLCKFVYHLNLLLSHYNTSVKMLHVVKTAGYSFHFACRFQIPKCICRVFDECNFKNWAKGWIKWELH